MSSTSILFGKSALARTGPLMLDDSCVCSPVGFGVLEARSPAIEDAPGVDQLQ